MHAFTQFASEKEVKRTIHGILFNGILLFISLSPVLYIAEREKGIEFQLQDD